MGQHGRAYALDESDAGYQIKAAASCPIDAAGRAGLRPYLFYRPNYRFFFFFSRKSRSSYPYKLSKPVFGPRPDYNLRVSRQISRVDALKTETHLSVSSRRQDWLRD
jgi:hypothetical protein